MAISIYDTCYKLHSALQTVVLSVIMLSVIFYFCFAVCRYAECRGAALGVVMLHSSAFI